MKFKQVAVSILVYAFFEVFALFMEGKLYHFKLCTPWFTGFLFVAFMTIFFLYLVGIYFYLRKQYTLY